jgi:hypothetical protein
MHRGRRRPDRTRLMAKFRGHERRSVEDFAEGPGAGGTHYPRNQEIGATRQSPADHNALEIEDLEGHGAGPAEGRTGAVDEVQREVIALPGGLENGRGVERIRLFERAVDAGTDGRARASDQVIGAALGFQATVFAAGAGIAQGFDGNVADLTREARSSFIRLAVEDEAPAHAGARGDEQDVGKPARGSVLNLRKRGRGGVVSTCRSDGR